MMVKPKKHNDDDGRVICRMGVEGMPQRGIAWNILHPRGKQASAWPASRPEQLTRSEAWRFTWYSVLAGLSIWFVFAVTLILFTLFCNNMWFQ